MSDLHWAIELDEIESRVGQMIAERVLVSGGIVGVGVDDEAKRDYFVPRLQKMLEENGWPIIFRVITVEGGMRATEIKGPT